MIEFKALAIKTETDDIYAIFLLKKNVRSNIIKNILGYPPIVAPKTLKKWKVAITSVRQEQEPLVVEKKHLQTLESSKTITTRTESLKALTPMYTDTQQRITKSQRKKKKLGSGTDITKQGIL